MTSIFRKDHPEPVTIDEGVEAIEVPAVEPPKTDRAKQIALYAFVALFLAVVGSSVAYLASRRSAVPAPAPPPVATVAPAAPLPAPVAELKDAKDGKDVKPAPPQQPQQAGGANASAKPVAAQLQEPPPPTVPQPQQSAAAASLSSNKLEQPVANRFYLQVGSLEKGVAEVLTQGLRARGIQATVAPGVSSVVSRIIVGPFENSSDMNAANRILTDLGFKPFPRRFDPQELRKLLGESASSISPVTQPDMRR